MRRATLLVVSAALLGCVTGRVRAEAASTLDCPKDQVSVGDERPKGTWLAKGCGRAAVCSLPDVDGAEIQCAGGGPVGAPTNVPEK